MVLWQVKEMCGQTKAIQIVIGQSLDIFGQKSSPTNSPTLNASFCRILRWWIKRKNPENCWFSGFFSELLSLWVVPLGLEPRTPWLWVRCSDQLSYRTCNFLMRVQNYAFLMASANFREFFCKVFIRPIAILTNILVIMVYFHVLRNFFAKIFARIKISL